MNIEHSTLNVQHRTGEGRFSGAPVGCWTLDVGCSTLLAFDCCRGSGRPRRSRPCRRGFTLVEVLIATLSFAVIMAALNTTFYAAMRLRSRATKNTENLIPMNQAATIIRRDLLGILPATNTMVGPLLGEPRGMMMSASSYLEFYTASGALSDDQPWADVQKVAYYLRKPEVAADVPGLDLIRSVTRNMLPVTTEDIDEVPIMTGIEMLDFEYYDGSAWQTSWDATTADPAMPLAIRMTIEFTGQNYRINDPLQFVVPLTMQAMSTNSTNSATSSTTTGGTGGGGTGGGGTGGGGTSGGGTSGGGTSGGGTSGGGRSGGTGGGGGSTGGGGRSGGSGS